MIMRLRTRHVALSIILLMVPHPLLKLQNPACGQEVSKDAEAALKERDRLWEETRNSTTPESLPRRSPRPKRCWQLSGSSYLPTIRN